MTAPSIVVRCMFRETRDHESSPVKGEQRPYYRYQCRNKVRLQRHKGLRAEFLISRDSRVSSRVVLRLFFA